MKKTLYMKGAELRLEYAAKGTKEGLYEVRLGTEHSEVSIVSRSENGVVLLLDGKPLRVYLKREGNSSYASANGHNYEFEHSTDRNTQAARREHREPFERQMRAPMPGKIIEVHVAVKEEVKEGQALLSLEAMKMENLLMAENAAKVLRVNVEPGDMVELGQVLVELEPTKR